MNDPTIIAAPADADTRPAMTYQQLSQTHPTYDGKLFREIEDLYEGGYKIQKKARVYLEPLPNEHPTRFEARCKTTSYQPYFGTIVDQFTSDLFGQPLEITAAADAKNPQTPGEPPDKDFYPAFSNDADNAGTPFVDVMKGVMTTALKHRCAVLCVDAPAGDPSAPEPSNLAEEESRGVRRLYVYELPLDQLIDWKCDKYGRFVWAITRKLEQERESPRDSRNWVTETFDVWTLDGGVAVWDRFAIRYEDGKAPRAEDLVRRVDGGRTSFERIPLLRFELPKGLWVGNKIGTQAREHYQRRSALVSAENQSLVAVPYVALGSEIGAPGGELPSEVQQDPDRGTNPVNELRGKGFLVIGAGDKAGFLEPEGKCYELVDKQLDGLREAMFAVNHQMAASIKPTGAALGRSGLSKQKDQDATSRVLRELGRLMREFALEVYRTIAKARSENVIWAAHGLDSYEHEDREQVIEESISLDQVQIPSVTFRKTHKKQVAKRLLVGADPATLAQIDQEIEEGVQAEEEFRDLQDEAKRDAIENPPPPVAPVPPSAKGPMTPKPPAPKTPNPAPNAAA